MSARANLYIASIFGGALLVLALMVAQHQAAVSNWLVLVLLVASATIAQFFEASYGRQSFFPHLIFFFAALLLVTPFEFALVVLVAHAVESLWKHIGDPASRRAWYIQPFNIATHWLSGTAALTFSASWRLSAFEGGSFWPVLTVALAACVYIYTNHILVGLALLLARGVTLRESGILGYDSIVTDVVMICLGAIMAMLWLANPWWIFLALSPLLLIYRALHVPQLKQQAQTDAKTGLLNVQHFNHLFTEGLAQAQRLGQPLAYVMADLDYLRNVNNTYGHLVGDAVLVGVSKIIRDTIGAGDIAGRFGGEEFAIVLVDATKERAWMLAERIRVAVENRPFVIAGYDDPIHVTMSLGVACYPHDGTDQAQLAAAADVALYQAKHQGRNRVVCVTDEAGVVPYACPATADSSTPQAVQVPPAIVPLAPRVASALGASRPAETLPPAATPQSPAGASRHGLGLFIACVYLCATLTSVVGVRVPTLQTTALLVVLVAAAFGAELLQIDVYGKNTLSVSVGVAFAAALLTGITGVVSVSAAIVIAHALKRRPKIHRMLFNWATHVLAGLFPAMLVVFLPATLDLTTVVVVVVQTVMAAIGYYLVDTVLIAMAMSLSAQAPIVTTWRTQFQWLAPHYTGLCILGMLIAVAYSTLGLAGLAICILPLVLIRYAQKQYVDHTEKSIETLSWMNHELVQAHQSLQQLNDEMFVTLARFFDARDAYVGEHAATVGRYAEALGRELGLEGERLKQLQQAGLLHDVGKIAVPEVILHKPSKLTDAEFARVKHHPVLGAELLERSQGLRHLAPFVRHHHERWDGAGYPDGLGEHHIPLEARILNVCDSVEAMASDRPYRRGLSLPEIIEELKRGSGSQFDADVVAAFLRIVERQGPSFVINSALNVAALNSDDDVTHRHSVLASR